MNAGGGVMWCGEEDVRKKKIACPIVRSGDDLYPRLADTPDAVKWAPNVSGAYRTRM